MNGPDVEGVLAGHRSLIQVGQAKACTCGWEDGFVPDATEAHRAHVAAAVLAEVRAWLESEAVDRHLERMAAEEDDRQFAGGSHHGLRAYEAVPMILAALAEQVGQVASSRVPGEES